MSPYDESWDARKNRDTETQHKLLRDATSTVIYGSEQRGAASLVLDDLLRLPLHQ